MSEKFSDSLEEIKRWIGHGECGENSLRACIRRYKTLEQAAGKSVGLDKECMQCLTDVTVGCNRVKWAIRYFYVIHKGLPSFIFDAERGKRSLSCCSKRGYMRSRGNSACDKLSVIETSSKLCYSRQSLSFYQFAHDFAFDFQRAFKCVIVLITLKYARLF